MRRGIIRWGRRNYVEFPWRSEHDPWLAFVAEFLLQRTRASQVESVFDEFRKRFPTVDALAGANTDAIRSVIGCLGLPSRAKILLTIARATVASGGSLPTSMAELCMFQGVGLYTAAAWLSLHHNVRVPILDSNVCRWLSRVTGLPYNRDPRHIRWVQTLADDLTPPRAFRDYNYAILDFTMTICKPYDPLCNSCPIRRDCRYFISKPHHTAPAGHRRRSPAATADRRSPPGSAFVSQIEPTDLTLVNPSTRFPTAPRRPCQIHKQTSVC